MLPPSPCSWGGVPLFCVRRWRWWCCGGNWREVRTLQSAVGTSDDFNARADDSTAYGQTWSHFKSNIKPINIPLPPQILLESSFRFKCVLQLLGVIYSPTRNTHPPSTIHHLQYLHKTTTQPATLSLPAIMAVNITASTLRTLRSNNSENEANGCQARWEWVGWECVPTSALPRTGSESRSLARSLARWSVVFQYQFENSLLADTRFGSWGVCMSKSMNWCDENGGYFLTVSHRNHIEKPMQQWHPNNHDVNTRHSTPWSSTDVQWNSTLTTISQGWERGAIGNGCQFYCCNHQEEELQYWRDQNTDKMNVDINSHKIEQNENHHRLHTRNKSNYC